MFVWPYHAALGGRCAVRGVVTTCSGDAGEGRIVPVKDVAGAGEGRIVLVKDVAGAGEGGIVLVKEQ